MSKLEGLVCNQASETCKSIQEVVRAVVELHWRCVLLGIAVFSHGDWMHFLYTSNCPMYSAAAHLAAPELFVGSIWGPAVSGLALPPACVAGSCALKRKHPV